MSPLQVRNHVQSFPNYYQRALTFARTRREAQVGHVKKKTIYSPALLCTRFIVHRHVRVLDNEARLLQDSRRLSRLISLQLIVTYDKLMSEVIGSESTAHCQEVRGVIGSESTLLCSLSVAHCSS
jgi:hypothetical protein